MDNKINTMVDKLVDERAKLAELREICLSLETDFRTAHKDVFDELAQVKEACSTLENELRENAVNYFKETGEKQIVPGLGIRVTKKLDYNDKLAFAWATEHKLALKLDAKKFEDYAKDGSIEFVTITEEPQATVSPTLTKIEGEI